MVSSSSKEQLLGSTYKSRHFSHMRYQGENPPKSCTRQEQAQKPPSKLSPSIYFIPLSFGGVAVTYILVFLAPPDNNLVIFK